MKQGGLFPSELDELTGSLPTAVELAADRAKRVPLARRFELFDEANPQVYATLVELTRRLAAKGAKRVGISMIWETMRYLHWMKSAGDPFKLNNDYRSRYARKIMETEPDLAGIFETRRLTAPGDT
jgi:hypothetical protein